MSRSANPEVTAAGVALATAIASSRKAPLRCACRAPASLTHTITRVEIIGAIIAVDVSLACAACAANAA